MILESKEKSAPFYKARRNQLAKLLLKEKFDAFLVTEMVNIRYLTGFTGSTATMLVRGDESWFLTDSRYMTQASEQVDGVIIREYKEHLSSVAALLNELAVKSLGFEAARVTVAQATEMTEKFTGTKLKPASKIVESIRLLKDEPEIEAMKVLIGMLAEVFPEALKRIRPGAVERDVALELEYKLRKLGGEGPAFDFIVASGERSAMPHGVASGKVIGANETVILDWGVKGWGYHSDNTRTLAVGSISKELKNIYQTTLEANMAAIEYVKPGVTLKRVDEAAREIIKEAGYGEFFGHGTGHGIGLCVHEDPAVSWRGETQAQAGMVFTIEPGIYLPGKGGVRIEDMVLVTENGCEVLSSGLSKEI